MRKVFEKIKKRVIIAATEACRYTPLTRVVSEAELKEIIEQAAAEYEEEKILEAMDERHKEIRAIIDELKKICDNSWIPVEERLPEDGEAVLATDGRHIYLEEYDADLDAGFGDIDRIVAWQPLPMPYQPKGE